MSLGPNTVLASILHAARSAPRSLEQPVRDKAAPANNAARAKRTPMLSSDLAATLPGTLPERFGQVEVLVLTYLHAAQFSTKGQAQGSDETQAR